MQFKNFTDRNVKLPIPLRAYRTPIDLSMEDEAFLKNYDDEASIIFKEKTPYSLLSDPELQARFERLKRNFERGRITEVIIEGQELVASQKYWWPVWNYMAIAYRALGEPYYATAKAILEYVAQGIDAQLNHEIPSDEMPPSAQPITSEELERMRRLVTFNQATGAMLTEDHQGAIDTAEEGLTRSTEPLDRAEFMLVTAAALVAMHHLDPARSVYHQAEQSLDSDEFNNLVNQMKLSLKELSQLAPEDQETKEDKR